MIAVFIEGEASNWLAGMAQGYGQLERESDGLGRRRAAEDIMHDLNTHAATVLDPRAAGVVEEDTSKMAATIAQVHCPGAFLLTIHKPVRSACWSRTMQ